MTDELIELEEFDVIPYQRGVSAGTIVSAITSRFLPGTVIGQGLIIAMVGLPNDLTAIPILIGALGLGYGLGLESLRRWMYPDAEVRGRRSLVAGLMSSATLAALLSLVQMTLGEVLVVVPIVGLVMAILLFFAWLSPTPAHMRSSKYDSGNEEQPRLSASAS
jgi:hypothetical protein